MRNAISLMLVVHIGVGLGSCQKTSGSENNDENTGSTTQRDEETFTHSGTETDSILDENTDSVMDEDIDSDTDTGTGIDPYFCDGKADFTRCTVITDPDRSYDICIKGVCRSPGCGTFDCNAPGPNFPLADTNQRLCFDSSTITDCPASGETYFGQDAQYGWDIAHEETDRYDRDTTVANEPVVRDNVTLLQWQGCASGLSGDDCASESLVQQTWAEALVYCDQLSWGGYTDWRLPDEFELDSIVDLGRYFPAIDTSAFPATPSNWFWSSSSSADDKVEGSAWRMYFGYGVTATGTKSDTGCTRCVRGTSDAMAQMARYARDTSVAGNPTVTDSWTGLVWQGCASGLSGDDCASESLVQQTWAEALAYCEGLDWGGYASGWRLPDAKELKTIVDHYRTHPAIDPVAFPGTPNSWFWSSSYSAHDEGDVWSVLFSYGYMPNIYNRPDPYYARCVRGGP